MRLKADKKELRALKIVQKNLVQDKIRLQREVIVQKNCINSSIVKIFDVFESDKEVYIVLEYMQGGELYDVILEKGKLIEQRSTSCCITNITWYCIYGRTWNYTSRY